jgi:hypothetical protein
MAACSPGLPTRTTVALPSRSVPPLHLHQNRLTAIPFIELLDLMLTAAGAAAYPAAPALGAGLILGSTAVLVVAVVVARKRRRDR